MANLIVFIAFPTTKPSLNTFITLCVELSLILRCNFSCSKPKWHHTVLAKLRGNGASMHGCREASADTCVWGPSHLSVCSGGYRSLCTWTWLRFHSGNMFAHVCPYRTNMDDSEPVSQSCHLEAHKTSESKVYIFKLRSQKGRCGDERAESMEPSEKWTCTFPFPSPYCTSVTLMSLPTHY